MPAELLTAQTSTSLSLTLLCARQPRKNVRKRPPRSYFSRVCRCHSNQPGRISHVRSFQIPHSQFTAEALGAVLASAVRETWTKTHSDKHTLQFGLEAAPEEGDEDMQVPQSPSLLVFSGGTAFNSVAGADMVQSNIEISFVVPACGQCVPSYHLCPHQQAATQEPCGVSQQG